MKIRELLSKTFLYKSLSLLSSSRSTSVIANIARMTTRSFSFLLLAALAHGQLVPTAFSSNTGACDSPFVTDCLALRARLQGSDNSTFQILHDTWTPINSYADCALSVLWPQNVGEGWLSPTYSTAADALDVMMDFGLDDDTISGVLARTDMGSDQQPIYWALTGAYTDNGKPPLLISIERSVLLAITRDFKVSHVCLMILRVTILLQIRTDSHVDRLMANEL
jgi:hypothetical protein